MVLRITATTIALAWEINFSEGRTAREHLAGHRPKTQAHRGAKYITIQRWRKLVRWSAAWQTKTTGKRFGSTIQSNPHEFVQFRRCHAPVEETEVAVVIKTIAATLDVRGQICSSISSIGLPHACLPLVKVFPGVAAGGCNVGTSIVAGLDSKSVPCPCVFLVAMELHMFFSSDFTLLGHTALRHGEINATHSIQLHAKASQPNKFQLD